VQPLSPGAVSGRRITQQVREGLLAVFEALGGEVALLTWAKENPSQFFGMWSKAVPRESESANRAQGITVVVSSAAEIARRPVIEAEVVDVTPRLDVEEELV